MLHKTTLPKKRCSTLRACEGFLACMGFIVCVQTARLREGLVAVGAGEGLIPFVYPLVFLQVTRTRKSQFTLGTWKWFFSSVCSHVL